MDRDFERGLTPGFEETAERLCRSLAESGPVRIDEFDDAWSPAGETYRDELLTAGLIRIEERGEEEDAEKEKVLVLSAIGVALAAETMGAES